MSARKVADFILFRLWTIVWLNRMLMVCSFLLSRHRDPTNRTMLRQCGGSVDPAADRAHAVVPGRLASVSRRRRHTHVSRGSRAARVPGGSEPSGEMRWVLRHDDAGTERLDLTPRLASDDIET